MNTRLHFENLTNLIFAFLALLFLLFSYGMVQINSEAEDEVKPFCDVEKVTYNLPDNFDLGMRLFKNNCASCHAKNMKTNLTGPALKNVEKRWNGNKENLRAWIRNSQAYLLTDDPYAKELYAAYEERVMTAFPNLKDEEIDAILEYINYVSM